MAEYSNNKIPLVAVVGPTASGKTSFAITLAKKYNGEIVSMDSMQIYKYLNIGTAKPDLSEMQGIPHHMMDFADPCVPYTASDYVKDAGIIIKDIFSRGKLPIVCGGTGLYLNSLLYGYDMSQASFDENLRKELADFAEKFGNESLHKKLYEFDPKSAEEIHPNNVKRVIRALEICILTGKPKSEQMNASSCSIYNSLLFGMDIPRDILYERINKRVDLMMEKGLKEEVDSLVENGILRVNGDKTQASQAIGYKELLACKRGEISLGEAVEQIKMNSRRYAKRQLTWFRRIDEINHLNPTESDSEDRADNIINSFLKGSVLNGY